MSHIAAQDDRLLLWVDRLGKEDSRWTDLAIAFLAITQLRALIEFQVYTAKPPTFLAYGVHFPLFYICYFGVMVCMVHLGSGVRIERLIRLAVGLSWVILIPPLVDVLLYGTGVRRITYLPPQGNVLSQFVATVFSRDAESAKHISLGQFFLVHGSALAAGYYCWRKSRRFHNFILVWALALLCAFFFVVFPGYVSLASLRMSNLLRYAAGLGGANLAGC